MTQRDNLALRDMRSRPLAQRQDPYRRGVAHGVKMVVSTVHAALHPEDLAALNAYQNGPLAAWSTAPAKYDDDPPPKPPRLGGEG